MGKYIVQRRGSPRTHQPLARGCKIGDVWYAVVHCSTNTVAESVLQKIRTDDGNGQFRIHYRPERRAGVQA
jgi:hypothetical protein